MASVQDINFLPPIDYTARDYLTIKSALVQHVQNFFPNDWQDFTEGGLGTIILELVAYVGDQLSFYLDRQANEAFLPTAVQRQNVLSLVEMVGYVPRSVSAAVVDIRAQLAVAQSDPVVIAPYTVFTDEDSSQWEFLETITIPVGRTDTQAIQVVDEVLGTGDGTTRTFAFTVANANITSTSAVLKVTIDTVQYLVTINSDGAIPVPFGGTGILNFDTGEMTLSFTSGKEPDNLTSILLTYTYDQAITAYQGVTKLDVFSSDGSPELRFTLSNKPVLVAPRVEEVEISPNPNRFEVWIGDPGAPFGNGTGSKWTRVDSLATVAPDDEVYAITFDDQDRAIINFGDNNSGKIPPVGTNNIQVIYRTGGGTIGNISVNRINSTVTGQAGLLGVTVQINNPEPASGGRERESIQEIRVNAPAFLRTNDTATTEQDFDTLSLFSFSGLGAVVRAKSRLEPSIQLQSKTVHSATVLGTVPVGTPTEYFLLLPATPIILSTFSLGYVVGGVGRTATASDLGGGLADLIGDSTLDVASRWRYDEQNFTDEILDFGDGSTFDFAGTLLGGPVFPGTMVLNYTIGGDVLTGYDDGAPVAGAGTLMGSGIAAGTINYRTGAVILEFGTKATILSGNSETFDLDNINGGGNVTMDVTIDGGTPQTITFTSGDAVDYTAVTAAEVKTVLDAQLTGATTAVESGALRITSATFGPTSSIDIDAGANDLNDATDGLDFGTTEVVGTGTAPDNATAILFDYQSCLNLRLVTAPDLGTDITMSADSGPNQIEIPTNNIQVYTWAEDASGNLVAPSTALRANLKTYLDTRRVLATSVEILAGFNVTVHYTLRVTYDTSIDQSITNAAIVEAIEEFFSSVVDVTAGNDVPLAAVYDAIYPISGVVNVTITDVGLRVPIGVGNGVKTVFQSDALIPGQYLSSGKLPAKSGSGNIKVYRGTTEIGSSDSASPTAVLSGTEVVGNSTVNVSTGAFDIRTSPAVPNGEVLSIDFLLDDDTQGDTTLWNIDVNQWEIAVLGDIIANGIQIR
jgi:hypothetical protein